MRAGPLRTTIRVPMRAGHPSCEQSMPRSTLMLRAPWAKRLGTAGGRASASAPRLDHVVVVIMENKSYDQVRTQTYISSLISGGTVFAHSRAITHHSLP